MLRASIFAVSALVLASCQTPQAEVSRQGSALSAFTQACLPAGLTVDMTQNAIRAAGITLRRTPGEPPIDRATGYVVGDAAQLPRSCQTAAGGQLLSSYDAAVAQALRANGFARVGDSFPSQSNAGGIQTNVGRASGNYCRDNLLYLVLIAEFDRADGWITQLALQRLNWRNDGADGEPQSDGCGPARVSGHTPAAAQSLPRPA